MTCDNKKLKKKLNFQGKFNINDIIKSSVIWEKSNG